VTDQTPPSALAAYPKGDKVHIHVSIYQTLVDRLDEGRERLGASRAEVLEALIMDWSNGLMPGVDSIVENNRKEAKR